MANVFCYWYNCPKIQVMSALMKHQYKQVSTPPPEAPIALTPTDLWRPRLSSTPAGLGTGCNRCCQQRQSCGYSCLEMESCQKQTGKSHALGRTPDVGDWQLPVTL